MIDVLTAALLQYTEALSFLCNTQTDCFSDLLLKPNVMLRREEDPGQSRHINANSSA